MCKYIYLALIAAMLCAILGCDDEATTKTSTNVSDGSSVTESVGENK